MLRSKNGKATVEKELIEALLARRMRWTWQELRSQPKRFIDILQLMERLDGEKHREDMERAERKSKADQLKAKAKHR